MEFDLQEELSWYRSQGAPSDQSALISLLKAIQGAYGGIPRWAVAESAEALGVKETYLLAVIRRIPRLRLSDTHCLEICQGPNCSKRWEPPELPKVPGLTVKYVPCMRMCGKGPNIRWDGKIYHEADETLIRQLLETKEK